ncbi:MAG: hypothetical protein V4706_10835 [Pseudomonadota bacterium]
MFKQAPLLVGALVTALSLTGCETMTQKLGTQSWMPSAQQNTPALTPAEAKLRADESRFQSTVFGGVVTGALMGAVAGAALSFMSGGNKKQTQQAALIGGLGGAVLGGVDGYATAKKERAGNNEVAAIRSAVNDLQTDNARLAEVIATSDKVLMDGRARLASMKSDLTAGRLSQKQAEEARAREEGNVAVLNKALEKAKETRTQYAQAGRKMAAPAARRDLDTEIEKTDRQIAQLERNVSEYNLALAVSRA